MVQANVLTHCVQYEGIAMSSQSLAPFVGQRYLTLESFKRDGTPVQTQVWFAEDHGVLYVYTLANAGKVKRIRRHPHIRLAPVLCAAQSRERRKSRGNFCV